MSSGNMDVVRPNAFPSMTDLKKAKNFKECTICCDSYDNTEGNWKVLQCDHKLCTNCFKEIEVTRATMSGVTHTSMKCPFCQLISGISIGTCPDGTMKITNIKSSCEGYEPSDSLQISYNINNKKYYLSREAYLPDNAEGNAILDLLKIAWDRRICFTIGTSVTTGAEDTVVWNIHHKTSQWGGISNFGYPDNTYFDRVKLELMAYGIEK